MATNASHGFESDVSTDDQTGLSTYVHLAAERAHDVETCANDVKQCVGVDSVEIVADGVPQFPNTEQGIICFECFLEASGDADAEEDE